jgi:protein-S-isoprenylcysteine O-methyltransferase Ste14
MGRKYMDNINKNHPGIIFHPPIIFIVLAVIALLADKYLPLRIAGGSEEYLKITGNILLIIWAIITVPTVTQMIMNKTTFSTHSGTTTLLTTGFFGYSRNPLYVSLFSVMAAIAFYANSFWFILMIPVLLVSLDRLVVVCEEKFLEEKFGEEYSKYKKNVRRWI